MSTAKTFGPKNPPFPKPLPGAAPKHIALSVFVDERPRLSGIDLSGPVVYLPKRKIFQLQLAQLIRGLRAPKPGADVLEFPNGK